MKKKCCTTYIIKKVKYINCKKLFFKYITNNNFFLNYKLLYINWFTRLLYIPFIISLAWFYILKMWNWRIYYKISQ